MKNNLLIEIESLMTGYWLTDLSNFTSVIFNNYENINWVGFYLSDGKKLRLGPFQGRPACTEIKFERGVCGAAFTKNEILLVNDVNTFEGHITCDPRSKSELVIPLIIENKKIGVLDIDSAELARFKIEDKNFFEAALGILVKNINISDFKFT